MGDMRMTRRKALAGAGLAFIVLLGAVAVRSCAVPFFAARFITGQVEQTLLCETDYHALLAACRELSSRSQELGLEPDVMYRVRFGPGPKAATFPQVIRDLKPSYVRLYDDGGVLVEMLGGLGHCGVLAYPTDFKPPYSEFEYGDKELIPGLWYSDDGYRDSPSHRKKIDAMIEKAKDSQDLRERN